MSQVLVSGGRVVWMAAWEFDCYGTPFSLGDEVEWTLEVVEEQDSDRAFAAAVGRQITDIEHHHGPWAAGNQPPRACVRGCVRSIDAVFRRGDIAESWCIEERAAAVKF